MMFHVKFLFFREVVVDAPLSKHRINSIMLTEENVSENFLAFELLKLFRENFLPKLVNETKY